jgi:DNA-binding NarL/FixJ family response regulator
MEMVLYALCLRGTTVVMDQVSAEGGRTRSEVKLQVARARVPEHVERKRSRIVMVDPHLYSAEGLRALLGALTNDLEIVSTVHGTELVTEEILRHTADLLIIEPRLPGALSAIKAARELPGDIKVIALTAQEGGRQAVEVMKAGAHAYISKQIKPEELVYVLRMVISGKVVLSSLASRALLDRPEGGVSVLNAEDRRILELIAEGLDNAEIARRLSVSESTLKRNISRVLKKLNARNKTQAVVRAASQGLLES